MVFRMKCRYLLLLSTYCRSCIGGLRMCWQCDHPEATWQDYVEHLRGLLEQHRWIVQGVQRERHRPPYAYTVGLPRHQRPELVVTGLPYDKAVDLLNSVAEH